MNKQNNNQQSLAVKVAVHKGNIDQVRKDLEAALAEVGKKYDLDGIKLGTIRYSPFSISAKVEMMHLSKGVDNMEQAEFERYCWKVGLKPDDYGRRCSISSVHGAEWYTVVGVKPKGRKNNVIVKRERDGKRFKTHVSVLDFEVVYKDGE